MSAVTEQLGTRYNSQEFELWTWVVSPPTPSLFVNIIYPFPDLGCKAGSSTSIVELTIKDPKLQHQAHGDGSNYHHTRQVEHDRHLSRASVRGNGPAACTRCLELGSSNRTTCRACPSPVYVRGSTNDMPRVAVHHAARTPL